MGIKLILNEFPIKGPLKEPLLILESLIVFSFIELAVIFWMRIRKSELKKSLEKGYIWLFLGYSLLRFFTIVGDYYVDSFHLRTLFLNVGYLIQMAFLINFVRIMENYKVFIRKYLFTKICLVLIFIYFIVFFIDCNYVIFFLISFWIFFIVFFIIYLKDLGSKFNNKIDLRSFKLNLLKFYIGMILIVVGSATTMDFVIEIFGFGIRLIGNILQLIGVIFISFFFFSIPSYSEYDWQDKIISVFIMHKSGLFIYKKSFREKASPIDESVITGALTTIEMMLEKVSHIDSISIIKKKEKILIFQPGRFIYGVLICEEELESLKILLSKFISKIETIYSNVLEDWDRNLNVFTPIEGIAKEIFY